jgi:hypothetical protein
MNAFFSRNLASNFSKKVSSIFLKNFFILLNLEINETSYSTGKKNERQYEENLKNDHEAYRSSSGVTYKGQWSDGKKMAMVHVHCQVVKPTMVNGVTT